ncbi:MAG: hypothetical protein R3F62_18495 [Planctomycetota bacterium]
MQRRAGLGLGGAVVVAAVVALFARGGEAPHAPPPGARRGSSPSPVDPDASTPEPAPSPASTATEAQPAADADPAGPDPRAEAPETSGAADPHRVEWSADLVVAVSFPDGTPAVGAEVEVNWGVPQGARALTDGAGLARLRCALAHDVYPAPPASGRLPMRASATVSATVERGDALYHAQLPAALDEAREQTVTLKLRRGCLLTLETDRPLTGEARVLPPRDAAPVVLRWEGTRRAWVAPAPGLHRVFVHGETAGGERVWAEGEVTIGAAPRARVLLRTVAPGVVEVLLVGVDGSPCAGWLSAERLDAPGEWALRALVPDAPTALTPPDGPLSAALELTAGEPRRLPLVPGRWRLRAAGADPDAAAVTRELSVSTGERVTLRLLAAPETRVSLPPAALAAGQEVEVHLDAPPGASLQACEGGLRVRGLAEGELARVVVVLPGREAPRVGVARVQAGGRASVTLQEPGAVEGHVAGAEDEELWVELVRLDEPPFDHRSTSRLRDLQEDAAYAADPDADPELLPEPEYVLPTGGRDALFYPDDFSALRPPIRAEVLRADSFHFEEEGEQVGDFRFNALPAGRYRARLREVESGALLGEGTEVTVEPGRSTRLELRAPAD